jgi:thiamine kinase-like enzyme
MLIAALQQLPALLQCLLALRYQWQYDALIHGDMKWDNLVIGEGAKQEPELHIIDWELVDIGDAAWDVGSVFASYLVDWLLSLNAPDQQVSLDLGIKARNRLVQMQPALRKFWAAYISTRRLEAAVARQYLEKCLRFTAARLVLAVFEFLYGSPQMTAALLSMLQASQNILLNPTQAASELLAL